MSTPFEIERRDPASGVLRLGSVLTETRTLRKSGCIVVLDDGRQHRVQITHGHIANVTLDGLTVHLDAGRRDGVQGWAEQLFVLKRPHVQFEPGAGPVAPTPHLDSKQVIVKGVRQRPDLFDPVVLAKRIPVATISLSPKVRQVLSTLDLTPEEQAFVAALAVPTPITMALWKRGLGPREAAVMVMALNLLGAFENWRLGDLPRLNVQAYLRRRLSGAPSDHALLGIDWDASLKEVDKAFRTLSFSLHPDRIAVLPGQEANEAREAFKLLSAAYTRIRHSRRSQKCRGSDQRGCEVQTVRSAATPWAPLLEQARESASLGDSRRAKGFAIKAMAHAPPKPVTEELKRILRSVA